MYVDDQVAGGRWREVGEEAVSRTLWIEAAYLFETWTHRHDAKRRKGLGVLR